MKRVLRLFGGPTRLYFITQVMTSFFIAAVGFLMVETFRQVMQDQYLGTWERRLGEALTLSRIELLLAVLLSALGGFALARHISKEMKKISNMTRDMARGKLSHDVNISGYPEEFGELGKALRELVSSLGRMVLESARNAEICIDPETQKVVFANSEASILLGMPRKEIEGKRIQEIVGDELVPLLSSKEPVEMPMTISSPVHGDIELLAKASIMSSDGGRLLSIVLIPKGDMGFDELMEGISRMEKSAVLGAFAAEIAHEIRNPLGAMKGIVQLILEDMPEDDPKRNWHLKILREINRVNDVVEDIYSVVEGRKGEEEDTEFDVNIVLKESLEYSRSEIGRSGISISETYTLNPIPVRGSPDRLFRALRNLLKNAIVFAGENVAVRAWESGGKAFISISNDGEHVSELDLGKIFDPFYTKGGGMGLGLSIAKRLVESEGGTIVAEAREGGGIEFIVSFPKAGGEYGGPGQGSDSRGR
jgi:signal transduction histidine kinase